MKSAIFSPKARLDIMQATDWISKDNPATAQVFRGAVEQAARNLGEYPLAGRERPDLVNRPFRFLTLDSFPYVFVYNPASVPPLILRVLHGARDLPTVLGTLDG
ncbi:MAG: type II toxin-antitoxin system RelE/ParE family toxin [Magnetococcales bacterium]|nr:type II toxin-antitoxin system RelE/ParE family toxin [Magnetococcales bacterium]